MLPKDGYWHIKVCKSGKSSHSVQLVDWSFDKLLNEIVKPYRSNKPFFINGAVMTRSETKTIKIVHSELPASNYGEETARDRNSGNVFIISFAPYAKYVFNKGIDFTSYLLSSDSEFDCDYIENTMIDSDKGSPSVVVTQVQSQQQTQSQKIDLSVVFNLQDAFADFKKTYIDNGGEITPELVEVQDVLDELHSESTIEQKTKVLSKLRRIVFKVPDTIAKIGGVASGIEVLKTAINAFAVSNGIAPIFP